MDYFIVKNGEKIVGESVTNLPRGHLLMSKGTVTWLFDNFEDAKRYADYGSKIVKVTMNEELVYKDGEEPNEV